MYMYDYDTRLYKFYIATKLDLILNNVSPSLIVSTNNNQHSIDFSGMQKYISQKPIM